MLNDRRQQILTLLQQNRFVTVGRLCKELYSSPATIRRDLAAMQAQGMITRMRGGAQLPEGGNSEIPRPLRFLQQKEKKEKIAQLAHLVIKTPATLFVDSSSTAFFFTKQIKDISKCTIITNGLALISYLSEHTEARVYCTGGQLLHQSSFTGQTAVETARAFHADYFIFSCCGFTAENGTSEANEANAVIKAAMLLNAKKRILLSDSTKFGRDYFCHACNIADIDLVLTDERPNDVFCTSLGEKLRYSL